MGERAATPPVAATPLVAATPAVVATHPVAASTAATATNAATAAATATATATTATATAAATATATATTDRTRDAGGGLRRRGGIGLGGLGVLPCCLAELPQQPCNRRPAHAPSLTPLIALIGRTTGRALGRCGVSKKVGA